ncbi:DNA mismatch repair protein [Parasponia andersonii]|uniref:DNA mismatch repair protein n=1 Tax=Parasponia andersonii TaxID=3476 RepID=A0A2P5CKZ5_PARAD|nr:DNA mismatch repair protein [Parasponia andersonii]
MDFEKGSNHTSLIKLHSFKKMTSTLLRTLYAQLNHYVTLFGKRLLQTWLGRPLYHAELKKESQEAMASLRLQGH